MLNGAQHRSEFCLMLWYFWARLMLRRVKCPTCNFSGCGDAFHGLCENGDCNFNVLQDKMPDATRSCKFCCEFMGLGLLRFCEKAETFVRVAFASPALRITPYFAIPTGAEGAVETPSGSGVDDCS